MGSIKTMDSLELGYQIKDDWMDCGNLHMHIKKYYYKHTYKSILKKAITVGKMIIIQTGDCSCQYKIIKTKDIPNKSIKCKHGNYFLEIE